MKRKWMRLAVAAMVTGVIGISGITYFNNRGNTTSSGSDPVAVELKKVSMEELNEFISNTAFDITDDKSPVTAKNNSRKPETKKIFADVSDKELDAFLSQVPTDDETDIN
jgi:hypothetical protein